MELKLIETNDPRLHMKVGSFVDFDDINVEWFRDLIDSMTEFMDNNPSIGLAAPQLGYMERVFLIHYGGKKLTCINPEIIKYDQETEIGLEGCLSYPKLENVQVKRHKRIKVTYKDIDNQSYVHYMNDVMARIFQHELDHLNGITIEDKINGY